MLFKNVMIGDGIVDGTLLLIDDIYQYSSCKYCWSKVQDLDICSKCNKKLHSDDQINDYNYIIHVETEDDIMSLFGFRRHLKIETNPEASKEELEDLLNSSYKGKVVHIDYLNDMQDLEKHRILNMEIIQ